MSNPPLLTSEQIACWKSVDTTLEAKLRDLEQIISFYSATTDFPHLDSDTKKELCEFICDSYEKDSVEFQQPGLALLKVLFRDKSQQDLECFVAVAELLLQVTGMKNLPEQEFANVKVFIEAEKCLINLLFNSQKARIIFMKNSSYIILIERISCVRKLLNSNDKLTEKFSYLEKWPISEIQELHFYDLKISFITSALIPKIQTECISDTEKTLVFINVFKDAIMAMQDQKTDDFQTTMPWKLANETLKTLFNFYYNSKIFDLDIAKLCADECAEVIQSEKLDLETKQNAVNLLAVMPNLLIGYCPKLNEEQLEKLDSRFVHDGYDMRFVNGLLGTFEKAIDKHVKSQPELLGTFLTALCHLCTEHKAARRFCRLKVLPPLKAEDVERPPEQGSEFRNKIIRFMATPGRASELAAEFLFILCKRSVDRLIKYCGFGHSAGLLANYGFLARALAKKRSASDSEDSATEDYREVEDKVNPVTGHIPSEEKLEEWRQMMGAMSEEQKEYEVMKLVDCMDKLMDQGVFKPGTIGEDGQPRQVKHIAELIKDQKEEEEHHSDSN